MYTNYRYKIVETSTYAILKEDAVVSNGNEIVIPSSGETSVDIARASWIAQKGIIIGSDLNIIRPTSSVHPLFLALSLSNNQVKYNLAKVAQGNSIVHLYNNNLKKVNIYFPNIVEQNRIGNILNSISNCINLHERKCEELALIKKALLQKLFPKKDEINPEVRYKNFNDAWEQRKLGEVAHIETGKLDANAMVENGKYDFYTSGIKKYRIDIPAFKGPAITIAGNGATVGYMHLADGEFNAYQRTYVLTKFLANRHFIFSEIGNKLPRKIQQESRAGNIPYIVMDMLTDLQLFLPSIAEQEKVGELLNKLNSLITLHQRKLEKLKQLKKFLLQNMFI